MKRDKKKEAQFEGRDRKRDKEGWKAQIKKARRNKAKRQRAEGVWK